MEVHTVGQKKLLGNQTVAKGAAVDDFARENASSTKGIRRIQVGIIFCDLVSDGVVERLTRHLTWAADGDVGPGNGKHAPCEGIAQGHWRFFLAKFVLSKMLRMSLLNANSTSVSFLPVSMAVLFSWHETHSR